jgi:acyl dehydratase
MPALTASDIQIGDKIPALRVTINAQKIISAAAATRDWQPIHHDHEAAQKAGLRGVIMNSPSQAGWISKLVTDWAGSNAEIRSMSFRMKDSICPGDTITLSGEITAQEQQLFTAAITIADDDKIKTSATVRFTVPT